MISFYLNLLPKIRTLFVWKSVLICYFEIYRRNKYLYNLIKSSFPIIVLLFEQQRRTCHTAVRRLYFATGHIVPGNFFYLILRIHFLSIYTYRLVIKIRSNFFAVHICGIIPVSSSASSYS